jgi:hypothetical protein
MRVQVSLAALAVLSLSTLQLRAYSTDEKIPDQESIAALEAKADQAQPREQCYLYAELVHEMTEFSLHEYAAGNTDKATNMLKRVQQFAHKVHLSVGEDNKRLKNAEILLRHTAFRLHEMLRSSSFEDRPLFEETLAQVNQAENEAMMQVFKK